MMVFSKCVKSPGKWEGPNIAAGPRGLHDTRSRAMKDRAVQVIALPRETEISAKARPSRS